MIRIILNILAIKWLRATKIAIFLEIFVLIAENFLPVNITFENEIMFACLLSYCYFAVLYFNLWSSIIFSTMFYIIMCANRVYLYQDSLNTVLSFGFLILPLNFIIFMGIHMILTKFGFLFIDAEVLRSGNAQLLDNLEEGIIILNETSNEVMFYNSAAAGLYKDYY